ncbi:MAG: hypothetical protein QOI13_3427, partial [Paraburkholderia sp.]|nr:hypothetical protein [Paraburkholderia sp.]
DQLRRTRSVARLAAHRHASLEPRHMTVPAVAADEHVDEVIRIANAISVEC